MPNLVNADGVSASTLVKAPQASPFYRRGYAPTTPFHGETAALRPQTTAKYGDVATFKVSNNRDFLGSIIAVWTDTAGTINSGAPARRDFFGFVAIEEATVRHTADVIDMVTGDQMQLLHRLWDDQHEVTATELNVGADGLSNRQSKFTQALEVRVPLRFWWTFDTGVYLASMSLGRDLVIDIKFAPKSKLFVTGGDTANYATNEISNLQLVTFDYHVSRSERAYVTGMHKSGEGVTQLISEMLTKRSSIIGDGTTTEFLVPVNAFRQAVRELIVRVRKQTNVADDSDNFWVYDSIKSIGLISGNDVIVPDQSAEFNRLITQRMVHTGECLDNIYCLPFGMAPQLMYDQTGARDFTSLPNLEVRLRFTTAPANGVVLYIDQTGLMHNMASHVGTSLRRAYR